MRKNIIIGILIVVILYILYKVGKIPVGWWQEDPRGNGGIQPVEPTEPEITPDDFTLPTEPVTEPPASPTPEPPAEEPKITTSELKQMVKNAIREIKKDLKNKR